MRFVDNEAPDGDLGEGPAKDVRRKALGRDVEQFQFARARGAHRLTPYLRRCLRVQRRRADAATRELVHLVLHQGNERRDDERDTRKQDGRQLKPEGFAGAGGHHRTQIASVEHSVDERLLSRPEGVVTEVATQRRSDVFRAITGSHVRPADDDGSVVAGREGR